MPARKSTKQSKQTQQQAATEAPAATTEAPQVDSATRRLRSKFSRGLRRDKATFDLVHSIVAHLAEVTGAEFATLWGNITTYDDKHFQRHFRKQRKAEDPFIGIKKAIPAYSFFTKEHNSKLAAQHPDKSFGDISKLVGDLWKSLSAKDKGKYVKLAEADKKRYQREVEQRTNEINASLTATPAPAAEEPAAAPAPAKSSRARGGRKSRK